MQGTHVCGLLPASSWGDLASGALTANTTASATVDAFTQSIVLGANLQNNSFTMNIAGHDQSTTVSGDIHGHHS